MTDYLQCILTGLFTGIGVIFAQKLVAWLDKHQITKEVKKVVNDVTKHG